MDKVKPLKIETAIDGTQTDPFPVETNPTQDYLATKGIAFENNNNRIFDLDGSGNIQFKDLVETAYMQLWKLRRAIYEIFDPTGSDLVSTNSEHAIKEVRNKIDSSASPGFSFGRTGVLNTGTWLQCETAPSNISGRWVYFSNAEIRNVFVSSENISTYSLDIMYHDGNGINLTFAGTVNIVAARGGAFSVAFAVPLNKQVAVKVSSGSCKNIVCGLDLKGTI
jgi:hypothetical protein